ncbi:MAG: hypothetical protein AB1744_05980 [Candidatus Zixiibacteriota bacterium]
MMNGGFRNGPLAAMPMLARESAGGRVVRRASGSEKYERYGNRRRPAAVDPTAVTAPHRDYSPNVSLHIHCRLNSESNPKPEVTVATVTDENC